MTEYFLHSTLEGHKGPINCASFIDDGRYLATGSKNSLDSNKSYSRECKGDDCQVIIWVLQDGNIIRRLKLKQGPVVDVKWLRDNTRTMISYLLSAGAGGTVIIWRFNIISVSSYTSLPARPVQGQWFTGVI